VASILRSIFGSQNTSYDQGPWGAGMTRGWLDGAGLGIGGAGSSPLTTRTAMQLSAVYACMRLLSEAVATMPLDTFQRSAGTRAPYRPRPEYLSFNPPQSGRIDYLSQTMLSILSAGDAFIATPRDDLGVPLDLVVIDPYMVKVDRDTAGRITFQVAGETYSEFDIMHIKGMCMPGALRGLSPLEYARQTIELGLSAQKFGSSFFNNGALPAGIIEAPGDFPRESAERAAGLWDARHRGAGNAGKVGVLTGGAKFTQVTIAPEQAQFLQTRAFQVPDIARFFGVPPHLIADASNSTSWGSGLAEQNLAFGQFSLRPWVDRIEEAHGRLLTTHGLADVFVKLNMDALLRAGTQERYDAYAVALSSGFLLPNEVRRLEDLPPLPGGDAPVTGTPATAAEVVQILKNAGNNTAAAAPVGQNAGGTP
jgi:HK97 family phage portal protein